MDLSIEHYPVVVAQARYQGVYEDGKWVAFPHGSFPGLDSDAFGGDMECGDWWADHMAEPIGRGETPDQAVLDMVRRLDAASAET